MYCQQTLPGHFRQCADLPCQPQNTSGRRLPQRSRPFAARTSCPASETTIAAIACTYHDRATWRRSLSPRAIVSAANGDQVWYPSHEGCI